MLMNFYLLLSSSQELSFRCWENLVITRADCWKSLKIPKRLIRAAQLTRTLIRDLLMDPAGRYIGREG